MQRTFSEMKIHMTTIMKRFSNSSAVDGKLTKELMKTDPTH